MSLILTALFPLLNEVLGRLFGYIERRQQHTQEIERMRLQMELARSESALRVQELDAQASISESAALRQPEPSYGVQLLDAAAKGGWKDWVVKAAFGLFAVLDCVTRFVRPGTMYWLLLLYAASKAVELSLIIEAGVTPAPDQIFNAFDRDLFLAAFFFWFGERALIRWKNASNPT